MPGQRVSSEDRPPGAAEPALPGRLLCPASPCGSGVGCGCWLALSHVTSSRQRGKGHFHFDSSSLLQPRRAGSAEHQGTAVSAASLQVSRWSQAVLGGRWRMPREGCSSGRS